MATNPIYVETEEEIPEVVERLRRFRGEDTMLVLPMRSRIGQSRFNFQLLRNYAARMGKRVTVVCDDPAVQKMASESGFAVFGAVGLEGEGIPSEPELTPPPRRWWQRARTAPTTHVGIAAPTKLQTKSATEIKPGRFLLYTAAMAMLVVGMFAAAIYVPSASVTLVAQAQPYTYRDVEIQAQPGKAPIRVRADIISTSNSQSFKTTGLIQVVLAPATGSVLYTNKFPPPKCPGVDCGSPGLVMQTGQRLLNANGIVFAQTSGNAVIPWRVGSTNGTVTAAIQAVVPGAAGNVGNDTITVIEDNHFDPSMVTVTNPQATGNGADPSSKPVETVNDFDAGRAQLEQELRQTIAQQLAAAGQPGEKLSETILFGPPQYTTDHQPTDSVTSFTGTMTLTGEGDFYMDADVSKAFANYLSTRVPVDEQLLSESPITVDYRILSATRGGNLTFLGTASAFVAPRLDMTQIRAKIVGRPLSQAKFFLQSLPIKSVTIREQPMTLPLMPLLSGRISLHYIVEPGTTTPTTSPAPSASPKPTP
ncbi:MAG TPA: baseplate J/gp47 family protein [Candidatus Dormibacteraeota bacterium]|nr:baseplate J/gp47 family protein [Candidatus Dormibacteraeota bacterium]